MGTVLQCRKFNFFDVKNAVDEGKLAESVKDATITSASSGFGLILIGDSKGWAHIINRQLQVTTFEAHKSSITAALIHSNSNLAVTVAVSKEGGPSDMKIWLVDRQDMQGLPICAQVLTLDPRSFYAGSNSSGSKSSSTQCPKVTAIALHPNNSLMAVGFSEGSVMLYRGDVRRTHVSKPKLIVTFSSAPITNLHIRHSQNVTHLFATTISRVYCINVTKKDKETTVELDSIGCAPGCSALADSKYEHELLIAKNDAIYSYTTDSRASCYVFDGSKKFLAMFKGYLIVASQEESLPYSRGDPSINLTVYDPLNKLISLSTVVNEIAGIVCEWGGIYIITREASLIHLWEKDLQSKFELLFKKNQFDIAISLAKMQCCDAEDVAEIIKQYGDWLYGKGNYSAAMDQYIKTIPHLEPSYIIKKFLDTQHINHLTTYLRSLHMSGNSTSDHTTLLLNCFTRLQDTQQLDDFIMNKQGQLDCDVDLGIKVCRGAGYFDHALALAMQNKMHSQYLSILINDKKNHLSAVRYIASLEFEVAHQNILQYGSVLLNHCSEKMTDLLLLLCTDYVPSNQPIIKKPNYSESETALRADPEDFEYLLVGHSEAAISFLERLLLLRKLSPHLNTTLLAELLHQYSLAPEGQDQSAIGDKILNMLRNDDLNFDRDHALLLCDKHNFISGKLILWEQAGMFEELLAWHAEHGDYPHVIDTCMRHAGTNQRLWCLALRLFTSDKGPIAPDPKLLNIILHKIEEGNLLPSLEAVDLLSSSKHVNLGDVRDYLLRVIASQTASLTAETSNINHHKTETSHMKDGITNITNCARDFTGTKCCVCRNNLDLPSIHFLCKHSFHMHCFESYTGTDAECPVCLPETKKLRETIAAQEKNATRHDFLQEQLEKSSDCFNVVADFISRGVFSNFQTLSSLHPSLNTTKVPESERRRSGLEQPITGSTVVSEGRLRLHEEPSKNLTMESEGRLRKNMNTSELNERIVSEGRLRSNFPSSTGGAPAESGQKVTGDWGQSSLHDHISKSSSSCPEQIYPQKQTISASVLNNRSITTRAPKSENPFEVEGTNNFGEESNNPFGDFETEESDQNPFNEGYDEAKNPFAADEESDVTQEHNSFTESHETLPSRRTENPFDNNYDDALNPFGET